MKAPTPARHAPLPIKNRPQETKPPHALSRKEILHFAIAAASARAAAPWLPPASKHDTYMMEAAPPRAIIHERARRRRRRRHFQPRCRLPSARRQRLQRISLNGPLQPRLIGSWAQEYALPSRMTCHNTLYDKEVNMVAICTADYEATSLVAIDFSISYGLFPRHGFFSITEMKHYVDGHGNFPFRRMPRTMSLTRPGMCAIKAFFDAL